MADPAKILIVDDDELVADVLARCCEEPDMTVIGLAANADTALALAQEHQPDVVLMDHRLDGADGVEVASRLWAISPDSKVVIVTGAASTSLIRAAQEAGCVGCIEKTISISSGLPRSVVSNGVPDFRVSS
jgi:DNA-binding NarL/FixJ family response regulator